MDLPRWESGELTVLETTLLPWFFGDREILVTVTHKVVNYTEERHPDGRNPSNFRFSDHLRSNLSLNIIQSNLNLYNRKEILYIVQPICEGDF